MACIDYVPITAAYEAGILKMRDQEKWLADPVQRSIQILNVMEGKQWMRLRDIAIKSGLAKNTAAMYLRHLEKIGAIGLRIDSGANAYTLIRRGE